MVGLGGPIDLLTKSAGAESSKKRKATGPPAQIPSQVRSPPFATNPGSLASPSHGRRRGHSRQESDLSVYRSPGNRSRGFPERLDRLERRITSPPSGQPGNSQFKTVDSSSTPFPPKLTGPASQPSAALGIMIQPRPTADPEENSESAARGSQQYRAIEPWPRQEEAPADTQQRSRAGLDVTLQMHAQPSREGLETTGDGPQQKAHRLQRHDSVSASGLERGSGSGSASGDGGTPALAPTTAAERE